MPLGFTKVPPGKSTLNLPLLPNADAILPISPVAACSFMPTKAAMFVSFLNRSLPTTSLTTRAPVTSTQGSPSFATRPSLRLSL